MLVCNVSLRPARSGIAAAITEAVTAVDAIATGNVVFATLVDDPASVGDNVNAYLGEIMLEAANADALAEAGLTYSSAINEAITASDTQSATAAAAPTTWDAATATAVTLSGGNLVATNTGTTSADQGVRVASSSGKTSGKYYFEITTTVSGTGGNIAVGICTTTSTYPSLGNLAAAAVVGNTSIRNSGNLWANGTNTGITIGTYSAVGQVVSVAVDLDNLRIWFRRGANNWNNSGTANPATNTGGIVIPAGTMVPVCIFGGSAGAAGNAFTANFGASAFAGTVPSGFTSGWPA